MIQPISEDAMVAAIDRLAPKAYRFEIPEAKRVVERALGTYFEQDAAHLAVTGVECEVELSVPGVPRVHGYTDIRAVVDDGSRIIIDWKTTGGDLDARWVERVTASWQWRFYAQATDASHVIYRGLSRNGSVRTVILEVPPDNSRRVETYIRQRHEMREGLRRMGATPWPQSQPEACNAYGRQCPYIPICRSEAPAPEGNGPPAHSYSSLQTFSLCPERSRLDAIFRGGGLEDEATSFGAIVHAGLAAAYASAFRETIVFPAASR